jgi:hypothetical protein
MKQWLIDFAAVYLPGFWGLIALFVGHVVLSTFVHITKKDFKIEEWPKCFKMWILFIIGILGVNCSLVITGGLADPSLLSSSVALVQAMAYGGYIGYYLDNGFKNLHRLNAHIPDGLFEAIKAITGKLMPSKIDGDEGDGNI